MRRIRGMSVRMYVPGRCDCACAHSCLASRQPHSRTRFVHGVRQGDHALLTPMHMSACFQGMYVCMSIPTKCIAANGTHAWVYMVAYGKHARACAATHGSRVQACMEAHKTHAWACIAAHGIHARAWMAAHGAHARACMVHMVHMHAHAWRQMIRMQGCALPQMRQTHGPVNVHGDPESPSSLHGPHGLRRLHGCTGSMSCMGLHGLSPSL
eukprot:363223-Chlamydomonas_euryale.AAC.5